MAVFEVVVASLMNEEEEEDLPLTCSWEESVEDWKYLAREYGGGFFKVRDHRSLVFRFAAEEKAALFTDYVNSHDTYGAGMYRT